MDRRHTILIVDDQPGIRILLHEVFNKAGYETWEAKNGYLAVQVAKKKEPDLVILDMKMPGMDGIETLQRLKEWNPDIAVIMMTAYGELDLLNHALELGAITHLTKPFDIAEIRQLVEEHLRTQYVKDRSSS